jgi:hypothetical protein
MIPCCAVERLSIHLKRKGVPFTRNKLSWTFCLLKVPGLFPDAQAFKKDKKKPDNADS